MAQLVLNLKIKYEILTKFNTFKLSINGSNVRVTDSREVFKYGLVDLENYLQFGFANRLMLIRRVGFQYLETIFEYCKEFFFVENYQRR